MPSLRDLEGEPDVEIDEEAAAEDRLDRLRLWKQALRASRKIARFQQPEETQ